jgi:hypothetical protein
MITREHFDQEQKALDARMEELRKKMPPKGEEPSGAKAFPAGQRFNLERVMEESRHPQREPERKVTPAFQASPEPQAQPEPESAPKFKPAPKPRPAGIATLEENR